VRKREKVTKSQGPEVPIAPFLDMAFQLLTFFVITYRPLPEEGQFLMNLLPAQPATSIAAEAPNQKPTEGLPVSLRTLPTILRAGAGGRLAEIRVGEQSIPIPRNVQDKALVNELVRYFEDPNLPFDQTLLKVDPNLKYSELMKVINDFSDAFIRAKKDPKLSFEELNPGEGA
jgi:biopolymer transport protein ExbD